MAYTKKFFCLTLITGVESGEGFAHPQEKMTEDMYVCRLLTHIKRTC